MNKNYLMATAVALLFAAAAAGAPANANINPVQGLTISNADLTVDHPGPGYAEEVCDDQLALLIADLPGCDFEEHTVGGFGYIILGFKSINAGNSGAIPLTGQVTAHLDWSGGEVVFTCEWAGGEFVTCVPQPGFLFPPVGETFTFDCYSEAGALGNWGECYVGHE